MNKTYTIVYMGDEKEVMNELYDAALITSGAVGISMASKKILGEPLGTPENIKGTIKMAVAIGLSSLAVRWAQKKKYIPSDPFKSN